MLDLLNRIMSGQPLTPRERLLAVAWALGWFLMDLSQWLDWLWQKMH